MIQLTCEICAKPFRVKPYRSAKARFCSFACGGAWHMSVRSMPNDHKIGNQWRKGIPPKNPLTRERSVELNTVRGAEYPCANCGSVFEIKPWLERQNRTRSGRRFCTKACHGDFKVREESGTNSAQWVGGKTTYRGKGWPEAREAAVSRDGGACQHCNVIIGQSIPVHHKRPYRLFATAAEANALDNLLCLCQSCHMREERRAQAT